MTRRNLFQTLSVPACSTSQFPSFVRNVSAGASNVSFGLPDRPALNAAFMAMAMTMGMDAAITNPLEPVVRTAILAADLFLGHDAYGGKWIKDFRKRDKAAK